MSAERSWDQELPNLARERLGNEGWLDTAARLEHEGRLTRAQRREVMRGWRAFVRALGVVAALFGDAAAR